MRLVVASPEPVSPATLALDQEQLSYEVLLCDGSKGYGRLLTDIWHSGTGFALLEWDIVPWPGAMRALWHCPLDYCQHRYVYAGEYKMHMGCVKFSAEFTKRYRTLPIEKEWARRDWQELAGHVTPHIANEIERPHEHWPPFAHVKDVSYGIPS